MYKIIENTSYEKMDDVCRLNEMKQELKKYTAGLNTLPGLMKLMMFSGIDIIGEDIDILSKRIADKMYIMACANRIVRACKEILCNPYHKIGRSNLLREFHLYLK